jgi:hypothetical protein
MRINTMKKIPKFKSEAEERAFWANADSTDYVHWSKARRVLLPNIKPSLRTISLRLPELMIDELKLIVVECQDIVNAFLCQDIVNRPEKKHNCSLDHSELLFLSSACYLYAFMNTIYDNKQPFNGIKNNHVSDDMALFSVHDVLALNT